MAATARSNATAIIVVAVLVVIAALAVAWVRNNPPATPNTGGADMSGSEVTSQQGLTGHVVSSPQQ